MTSSKGGQWYPGITMPSGFYCPSPFFYQFEGDVYSRPCGYCPRCIASKKNDLTARAAAESYTSDEVIVYTLTYRDGEAGAHEWVTEDRQAFIRALRDHFTELARQHVGAPVRFRSKINREYWVPIVRRATKTVRYFGVGETGKRGTRRCHYHMMIFLSGGQTGPSGFRSTPRQSDGKPGREHIKFWRRGWSCVDVLPSDPGLRVQAVRYCVKYLHKARGGKPRGRIAKQQPDTVMFRSLKPALGAAYLAGWAIKHVDAGLPLPDRYQVIGYQRSVGDRALHRCKLTGVARRIVAHAYVGAWRERYGEREIPFSKFLRRSDDGFVEPFMTRRPQLAGCARPVRPPKADGRPMRTILPPLKSGLSGWLLVGHGDDHKGAFQMIDNGVVLWHPVDGRPRVVDDGDDLDEIPLDPKVQAWVEGRRGRDWVSPRARFDHREGLRLAYVGAMLNAHKSKYSTGVPGVEAVMSPMTRIERMFRIRSMRSGRWTVENGKRVPVLVPVIQPDGTLTRREFVWYDVDRLMIWDHRRKARRSSASDDVSTDNGLFVKPWSGAEPWKRKPP